MKKQRICAAVLAISIISGLLTACGSKEEESPYQEFLIVDVFDSLANYQGLQSGWYAKIIKEKFNMQLNIIAPNVSGGGDTLFKIRAAAGNVGDLIIGSAENGSLQDMVDAGLLYNMEPLLEGSDIMEYRDAIESLNDSVRQEGIYAIPSEISRLDAQVPSEGLELNYGTYLRWDAYEELGYPEITDFDSLLDVLEDMQELVPTADNGNKTYAFSLFKDWDGNLMNNAKQPACLYGYDEIGFVLAKADGSDCQDILQEDSWYLKSLKMFNQAYQRGLLDPDSLVQNYAEVFEKYRQGEVLFSFWPWLGQSAYNTEEHVAEGKGFMLASMEGTQILSYGCNPSGNHKTVIAIGSQAKDPHRLADFIDWLYSPEGIMISGARNSAGTAGPMGLTWEMKDGEPVLTEFGHQAFYTSDAAVPEEWGGGTWSTGLCELNYISVVPVEISPSGFSYYYNLWDSVRQSDTNPLQESWKEHMGADTTIEYLQQNDQMLVAPGNTFVVPEESAEMAAKRSQCRDSVVNYSWKMVYAENDQQFQELYQKLLNTVKDLGYEQVLEHDMENARLLNESRKEALR